MPIADGPFKIIAKQGDNAYTLELPPEMGVAATFNIGYLVPYTPGIELRAIPFPEGGVEPSSRSQEDPFGDDKPKLNQSKNIGQDAIIDLVTSRTLRSCLTTWEPTHYLARSGLSMAQLNQEEHTTFHVPSTKGPRSSLHLI